MSNTADGVESDLGPLPPQPKTREEMNEMLLGQVAAATKNNQVVAVFILDSSGTTLRLVSNVPRTSFGLLRSLLVSALGVAKDPALH